MMLLPSIGKDASYIYIYIHNLYQNIFENIYFHQLMSTEIVKSI